MGVTKGFPILTALAALLLAGVSIDDAAAQPADPFAWPRANPEGQSVRNRPRPELDPLGVRVGTFRFYPSLDVEAHYEDNVFRSASNERGDFSALIRPRFRLESDWPVHALALEAEASARQYADETSENRETFKVGASGRLDLIRDASLTGRASYARDHESRVSPDSGRPEKPVRYDLAAADVRGDVRLGLFNLRAEAGADRFNYEDARQTGTGVVINHDDRDRTVGRAALRGGYEPVRGTEVYLRVEGIGSDYDDKVDDGGFDRDSAGADVRVGAAFSGDGVTAGEVYVGFRGQYYQDDGPNRLNRDEVEALILGGRFTSNVTTLTTIYGAADRGVFESTLAGSPGGVATRAEVGVDHELLRNLLLNASIGGRVFEFEGIDRDDYGLLFRFGAEYLMNRNLSLVGAFEHETYRSSGARQGIDNTSNRVMLRLTAQP